MAVFGDSSKSLAVAIFTPFQFPSKKDVILDFSVFLASSKLESNSALKAVSIAFASFANSEFSDFSFST